MDRLSEDCRQKNESDCESQKHGLWKSRDRSNYSVRVTETRRQGTELLPRREEGRCWTILGTVEPGMKKPVADRESEARMTLISIRL